MNFEVTENLLGQKMMRRYRSPGQPSAQPSSQAIRAGHANLPYHLDYIGYLVERRRWLGGEISRSPTLPRRRICRASTISATCRRDAHEPAKEWYARIKSRPSFRAILADHVAGVPPPPHTPISISEAGPASNSPMRWREIP